MPTFPLHSRLKASVKQPQEIAAYSLDSKGDFHLDDSSLKYYYFPESFLDRKVDLSSGFDQFICRNDEQTSLKTLLQAIMDYEKKVGHKVKADIISWRGIMTGLMCMSAEAANSRNMKNKSHQRDEGVDLNVTYFDGQIFLEFDAESTIERKKKSAFPNQELMMYWGYKFEAVTTLSRPWGECSRKEIEEDRFTEAVNNHEQYCSVVRTGVGNVRIVLGGEVDCALGYKPGPPENLSSRYIELKTTKLILDVHDARTFERKLMRTWAQSFLLGVPYVTYGFRDENGILGTVEEYKTEDLPVMVKNSKITYANAKWNGMQLIESYAAIVEWIKSTVLADNPPDHTQYRFSFVNGESEVSLTRMDSPVSRLYDGFVQWREELKVKDSKEA